MTARRPRAYSISSVSARRSGLTSKALPHYDHVSLLRPTTIDSATGYRLYRGDQVAQAHLVHLLRFLDLPLAQVRAAVAAWKPTTPQPSARRSASTGATWTHGSPARAAPCTVSATC